MAFNFEARIDFCTSYPKIVMKFAATKLRLKSPIKGMRKHLKVVNYERPCKNNDTKRNLKHIILQTRNVHTKL